MPAADWLGSTVFFQTPLYPYFLGALYTLAGRDLLVVRLIQLVLGSTSCVLLALAGRHFFGRTVGIVAGTLLAVYPTAVFYDGSIQKPVLDIFSSPCCFLPSAARLRCLGRRAGFRWGRPSAS